MDGAAGIDGAARTGPPVAHRRAPSPRYPGRGPGAFLGLAAVALALIVIAWFLISLFQPLKGDGHGAVLVVVRQGSGVGQIGDLLERQGVVPSSFFFTTRARLAGKSGDLKPGTYRLRQDMSYGAALNALSAGVPPQVVRLAIPEGRSRTEVAQQVPKSLRGSYLAATRSSPQLNPRSYGAPRARSLEGFLFPATYELKRGKPVSALVSQQLAAFKREFGQVALGYARSKNLTAYDVITIASMVEREAQVPSERPLVASVIYNRLKRGIPLGIDATIRYATNNWLRPLRQSELQIDSPYNTRTRRGLPPGPIGNPGLASLQAAAKPARTGYLFYVVKPCGRGEHAFAKTDAQFQRLVERYNAARAKRGGKSPTDC